MSKDSKKHPNTAHREPDKNGADHNKRHVEGSITVHGQLETHLPPELRQKEDDREDKRDGRDQKRFVVEILTLIFVIFGAGLTGTYVYLTHSAITDSRNQFIQDQRPYVWDSAIEALDTPKLKAGERIVVNIHLVNFGKSPAVGMQGKGRIFFGQEAMKNAYAWFDSLGGEHFHNTIGSTIVLAPGIPSDLTKTLNHTSISSFEVPTDEDIFYIEGHDMGMIAVNRIQYWDMSGNFYQSDLCFGRLRNGSMYSCNEHNEVH